MARMYMNGLSEWLSVKIIARYTVDWQANMTLIIQKLQKMYNQNTVNITLQHHLRFDSRLVMYMTFSN
jgi:hypothetical protein